MQQVIKDANPTPLIVKNVDTTQVELQRQIDKLNSNISKGTDREKIIARINTINEDIALVRAEHEKEREAMKTWGMSPKTWKWGGAGATVVTVLADTAAIASNIPLTALVENTTITIIVTTSVTSGVGLLAAAIFGVFTYGQYKMDARLEAFDQKVRQNELLSIFLNSYQTFMDNTPDHDASHESLETQVAELKKCVEQLKNISPSTVPEEAKDYWLSSMIQNLSDNSEHKKKLVELKTLAQNIEERKNNPPEMIIQDAHSEQGSGFLQTERAHQAADITLNMTTTDPLRERYDANLQALREEFGLGLNKVQVGGYKLNADAKMKKIEKKPKSQVVIEI